MNDEPRVVASRPSFKHPRDSWDEHAPSALQLFIGDHQLFPWPSAADVLPLQRINMDTALKVVRAVRGALEVPMPGKGSTLSILCVTEGPSVRVSVRLAEVKGDILKMAYRAVHEGKALAINCESSETALRYDPSAKPATLGYIPRETLVRVWNLAMRTLIREPGDETRVNEIDFLLHSQCDIWVGSPIEMCKYR